MNNPINHFMKTLNTVTPIPSKELEKLKDISKLKKLNKGEYFLRQGDRCSHIAFVIDGLFRITYLTEEGKEFTKSFLPENSFLISYSALVEERESYFSIEALENSTIIVIDYHEWLKLFKDEVSWHKLLVSILQKAFCKKEAREREFLLFDAQARYQSFLENHADLNARIKQHVLASYLGITPVALSNLKKKLKS